MSHAGDPELSGRHPVNIGHLVMGLAFVGLVGVWALIQGDVVRGDDIRWLLPVPWVLAGIAGLLATTLSSRGSRNRRAGRQTEWVGTETGYEPELGGPEGYAGYPYDSPDWTTDDPYRTTTDPSDTPEETR
ncbi:MAG: hypothetical protein ABWX57_09770 [Aeromicrobium sp.]